ncbi:MAG: sigma-54 dependent transcriptional regulator [Desulfovibrionaceae bacterium]|nr:sigma-54 dependent transcriptional regulator [Desulfovibrionaceae bacterium]
MARISELLPEIVSFCDEVAAGRREEALKKLPALSGGLDGDEARLLRALKRLLDSVEEREAKLTDLIAELAALRADQESRAEKLTRENSDLRDGLHGGFKQAAALTNNPAMRLVFKQASRIASVAVPVLITGETGTGKGLVAKYIHYNGSRAKFPLVSLNCAAIPASLLESELFGIEKGVASGVNERLGHFESASSGTLFLDEIGDMPLESQAKILKAIESNSVTRVGGRKPLPVDTRLISATHRDLEASCAKGEFRQDLFYRLKVIQIHIPPLRERRGDIIPLAEHFLRAAAKRYGLASPAFAPESLRLLEGYAWPGNVRELEHEVDRAVLLAAGPLIQPGDLSRRLADSQPVPRRATGTAPLPRLSESGAESRAGNLAEKLRSHPDLLQNIAQRMAIYSFKAAPFETAPAGEPRTAAVAEPVEPSLLEVERKLVQRALKACEGNKTHAAKRLGLSREGLRKKLKRLGLA